MANKTRWLVGSTVVAVAFALTVGLAGAMGSGSTRSGMMGSGSTGAGMMSDSMAGHVSGGNMASMHDSMMASMGGQVPVELLAQCEALHAEMGSYMGGATGRPPHASHHNG